MILSLYCRLAVLLSGFNHFEQHNVNKPFQIRVTCNARHDKFICSPLSQLHSTYRCILFFLKLRSHLPADSHGNYAQALIIPETKSSAGFGMTNLTNTVTILCSYDCTQLGDNYCIIVLYC